MKKFTPLSKNHDTESWSKEGKSWDYSAQPNGGWVGGHFKVPNLSNGYHGILKQWWDHYSGSGELDVLLVSEGNGVKVGFNEAYPKWNLKTTDKFYELQTRPDIIADICTPDSLPENEFDLVINQATMEHVYNPWAAINNCIRALRIGGNLVVHTHPPVMPYHSFPRDYIRFMKDWWYDIPYYNKSVELMEFFMLENRNVFALYRKKDA